MGNSDKKLRKVSIIIPVIRPEKVVGLVAMIKENAGIDQDRYTIIIEHDSDGVGCPQMVKQMMAATDTECICFIGDDTLPQDGFLVEALRAMDVLPDGWGLVGFNDLSGRKLPTHWLADRRLLPMLDNEFFYTGYNHHFCDNELVDRCVESGRYVFADKAIVKHDHDTIDFKNKTAGAEWEKVARSDKFKADEALYKKRKKERKAKFPFKLGIGLPITDEKVHLQFMLSFMGMDKQSYTLLVPKWSSGRMCENIATARNSIVSQALSEKITHLIMCDTDQIYPPDCIAKLLSHGKDIVGVRIHRRYPPFELILNRGELTTFSHVPDTEGFSGQLIKVDATGMGCMLIKMSVFDDLDFPWFYLSNGPTGQPVGEDIRFCDNAGKAGYNIFVDTSIEVGHMTTMVVNRAFYEIYKGVKGYNWNEPKEEKDNGCKSRQRLQGDIGGKHGSRDGDLVPHRNISRPN